MTVPEEQDQSYGEAWAKAMGRQFAGIMAGMLEGGMAHDDALAILKDYTWAIGSRLPETPSDEASA